MTDEDWTPFVQAMAALDVAYRQEASAARAKVYYAELRHYALAAVQDAIGHVMRRAEVYPTIAALGDAIDGAVDDLALLAWSRVERAAAQCLAPGTDDPATVAAIELMGGWREVRCVGHRDVLPVTVATLRKEFCQFYRIARTRHGALAGVTHRALEGRSLALTGDSL